jgi:hypothetical protein
MYICKLRKVQGGGGIKKERECVCVCVCVTKSYANREGEKETVRRTEKENERVRERESKKERVARIVGQPHHPPSGDPSPPHPCEEAGLPPADEINC